MRADLDPTWGAAFESRSRARRRVGQLLAFAAYGLGLSLLYATTGIGLPCPLRALTGWVCPFCGATRMGAALLHGDLAAAAADNGVVLGGLGVLTVLGLVWLLEALGGPALRFRAVTGSRLLQMTANRWLVLGLGLAVTDTLLRNLG